MDIKLPLESTINSLSVSFDPIFHEWKVITCYYIFCNLSRWDKVLNYRAKKCNIILIVPLIEGCLFNLKSLWNAMYTGRKFIKIKIYKWGFSKPVWKNLFL